MSPSDFRKLALALPSAEESAHMNHPDFRVGGTKTKPGKIFASLGYPDDDHGMVKLTPAQQKELITAHPEVFAPAAGAWGKAGATTIKLGRGGVTAKPLRQAIQLAWQNTAPKPLVQAFTRG